jgi:hypothetical protein
MAAATVVQCQEVSERTGGRDQNSNRVYTRDFQIITSDATAGSGTVLDYIQENVANFSDINTGEPASVYEEEDETGALVYTDVNSVCVDIKCRQNDKDNLQNWFVTVFYVGIDDPTLEPAEIDSGDLKYQEAMVTDLDVPSVPCVNSAGDPLQSGIMRDRTRLTLTVIKNIPWEAWDPVEAAGFIDTLNDYLFGLTWFPNGFPVGTVKLTSLTAKRIQRTDQLSFYGKRRAFFEIDLSEPVPGGIPWNAYVRDCGFQYLDSDGNKQKIMFFGSGLIPSTPQLLDGNGHILPPGGTPVVYPSGGFIRYEQADWTSLNLETP